MIKVDSDSVTIESNSGNGKKLSITALGGPKDNVLVRCESGNKNSAIIGLEVDNNDLQQFQLAVNNFLNSGYFDVKKCK